MNKTVYLLLRIGIGTSMLGHGLVRLPKLTGFSNWMMGNFEKSFLPLGIVQPFSYFLPIAEFVIGLFLVLGIWTKQTAMAGGIVMIILIFGSTMVENWEAIPSQLIHILFFAGVLQYVDSNSFYLYGTSIDKAKNK